MVTVMGGDDRDDLGDWDCHFDKRFATRERPPSPRTVPAPLHPAPLSLALPRF